MPRGYRSVVFAVIGIALLGASPPNSDHGNQSKNASNEIKPALDNISTAVQQAGEPGPLEAPCEQGHDYRWSDLCAQWKAADAAKSASDATWLFGIVGSIIGSLTLAAAWSAAKWAKKAAQHTETAANEAEKGVVQAKRSAEIAKAALAETRKMARLQLRPYLFFTDDEGHEPSPFQRDSKIPLWFKNFGQTPALNVKIQIDSEIVRRPIGNHVVILESDQGSYGTIAPGALIKATLTCDLPPEAIAMTADGQVLLTRTKLSYDLPGGGSDEHDVTWMLDRDELATSTFHLINSEQRQRP